MNANRPQDEMKQIIQNCIDSQSYPVARDCLNIYKNTFGYDSFYLSCESVILDNIGPLVSVICLPCDKSEFDSFLTVQTYKNLEAFFPTSDHWETEISDYIAATNSKYVCFYEPFHKYDPNKIARMTFTLECQSNANTLICDRNFIDENDMVIANTDTVYQKSVKGQIFTGRQLIEASIKNNINLYGSLSTIMLSTDYVRQLRTTPCEISPSMRTVAFFYHLLFSATVSFLNIPLVSSVLQPAEPTAQLKTDYENYVQSLYQKGFISQSMPEPPITNLSASNPGKHEITFFCTDNGEYFNLKPLADEADRRGFKTVFTKDPFQKAEIGIYCQHFCAPENSSFSVILLHDLAQGHNRWPNIWEIERWNKFDIGILPGKSWAERWSQCANQYYANPRCGVFNLGYPKNDMIHSDALKQRAQQLREQLNLKYDISVLYAPSWENDGKEDDFVKALSSLKVNLLIKQFSCSPEYEDVIVKNINEMRSLHEGSYENVYYIDPKESIQTALALCDYVISEESSVMYEALMFRKPSISVTDWLIPDKTPKRYASVPVDYFIKCKKNELKQCVTNLLQHPEISEDLLKKGIDAFESPDHVCKNILDAIEYYISPESERTHMHFNYKKLLSKYAACSLWN